MIPELRLLIRGTLAPVALAVLVACGGGGGSVLGGSQSPDPVIVDYPVVYVRRPLLTDDNGNLLTRDVRNAVAFFPGAALMLRDRASPTSDETLLTAGLFPDADGVPALIDVRDPDASPDGSQVVFALRAPAIPDAPPEEQPTWNIWLYDHPSRSISRVIASDLVAEEGDDISPRFLPDGRIVFASTRQRDAKAILLDEGKPQFAALDEDRRRPALSLHVMDADGTNIRQISFNASSDFDAAVLADGSIAYSRWDNVAGIDRISLYRLLPDGRDAGILYGAHSHDSGPDGEAVEFTRAREMPDGRLLVMLRPSGEQSRLGVLPVAIDVTAYVDNEQPTAANSGLVSQAQELLIAGDLTLDDNRPPLQGRYASAWPLFDGSRRLLVSWSQCRLQAASGDPADPVISPCTPARLADPAWVEAAPLYGIWMHDLEEATAQPIVPGEPGMAYTDAVVMEPRPAAAVVLDGAAGVDLDADLVAAGVGIVHIRSVYDVDGMAVVNIPVVANPAQTAAAARPARFVRIVKSVSMPDDDVVDVPGTAFGASSAQLMREVIGYAPVEPDGSVRVQVPANVAFWFDVLDAEGHRIGGRHNNWLQVRAGEVLECTGCHEGPESSLPHGRRDAQPDSANPGAPTDGLPFPNTDPALFADAGETMAEVWSRINGTRTPSVDITFDDVWTDATVRPPDPSFAWRVADLNTPSPVDAGCVSNWQANCRLVINYPGIIHPLWSVDRRVFAVDGVTLVRDDTCTSCHNVADAADMAMVPAAQLDLSDGDSDQEPDHLKSYRELFFNDNEQEVVNGVLQDRLVQATDGQGNPQFQRDAQGNLILDANGAPIPVLVPVGVTPVMNVAGASASTRFFPLFAMGGSHAGRLSDAELKLLGEWLDIGGQYYNDPFAVPQ